MASSLQEIINASANPIYIPPNVNPFAYLLKDKQDHFSRRFPKSTEVILGILLTFHSLIVIFCSFILIISCTSGAKQARWLVRKLYIKDDNGQKAYKRPLYFLNAGILMNVSQLLCSCVSQAFMWIQIKSSQSVDYAIHAQIMPCFGLIYTFETLSYWSMTHCFLVTIYFSSGFNRDCDSGLSRWISPPFIINFFFVGFPIFVTVITVVLMTWTTVTYNRFTSKVLEMIQCLNRGSSAWQMSRDASQSVAAKNRIGSQMILILSDLQRVTDEMDSFLDQFSRAFRFSQEIWLALVCMSCAVFLRMFFLLIRKYRRSSRQSRLARTVSRPDWLPMWLKRENFGETAVGPGQSEGEANNISVILPNRQFFYLLLRAIGVFLSMITQMTVLLIGAWKGKEIVTHKSWKGVTTWLLTLSSVWSAAPIAWQCWKLYVEETAARPPSTTEKIYLSNIDENAKGSPTNETINSESQIKFPVEVCESLSKLSK